MNDILNNQSINSSLLHFDPVFKRRDPNPRPMGFRMAPPEKFTMLSPCKNLGNNTVRLTYYNPTAKNVEVFWIGGSMPDSYPMTRDEQGYWTVDLTLAPGIHVHRYRVDGTVVINPEMPFCYSCGEPANYFETVDDECDFYMLKDVPHGDLRLEYYRSSYTGRWKACWVYTPPSYESSPDRDYPVLYLQHGAGEDETGWIDMGRANYIADNLIAEGKCEEMLIVMNAGFSFHEEDGYRESGFTQELVKDCVPFIEGKYRCKTDRDNRAVAGLSMGSSQAQQIAYEYPELFAYCGVIIGWFIPATAQGEKYAPLFEDIEAMNAKYKVFFGSNGEQEDFYPGASAAFKDLIARGMTNAFYYSCPGFHELTVCRKSLRVFLPMLFK